MKTIFSLISMAVMAITSPTTQTTQPTETKTSINKIAQTQTAPIKQAQSKKSIFDINTEVMHLSKQAPKLNKKVLAYALNAYVKASSQGNVKKPVLTVIDYSLPSSKQRMWVFDLNKERLLYNTHVAHGQNSGMSVPHHFSNRSSSKETSLGTYITKDTYMGSKGYSLNLKGLEKGFNDNAYSRRVVMHGAWYVEPNFIHQTGRAGRSWGCPSIAKSLAKPVINTIKGGSVIFAYFPDKNYLSHSRFV